MVTGSLGAWSIYGIPAALAVLVCAIGYFKSRP